MSRKVTAAEADLENSNRQRGRVAWKTFICWVSLKKPCWSSHRPLRADCSESEDPPVSESGSSDFLLNTQVIHFTFTSAHPAKRLLPPCPVGSSEVPSSSCQRRPASIFTLFIFTISTFPDLKTRRGTSTSVKGSKYHVPAAKTGFSWGFEIKSQTPFVTRRCSGARSWSVVSSRRFVNMFCGIFNTKYEKGDPRLLLHHADMELFRFLHTSQYWWDVLSVEQWYF